MIRSRDISSRFLGSSCLGSDMTAVIDGLVQVDNYLLQLFGVVFSV